MKKISALLALLALCGCSQTAAPLFFNGQYYMAGDPSCRYIRPVSNTRVMCNDGKDGRGRNTGWRDAMTLQQIQMYQMQVMQNQMYEQQMAQSIAANNAAMAASTQATLANASVYQPPVVTPISRPGGDQIRCIGVGIYANCRSY